MISPLVSAQPAGASPQQVMSPTLGQGHYGTLGNMPSPLPGRDGHPGSQDATPTPAQVHAAGGVGFASDTAAGRASGGGDPAEGTPQVSTTTDGGMIVSAPRSALPRSIAPGGSPGPEANASAHQAASSEARPATDLSGGGVLGGIRSTGETVGGEGFVTPRSQQGLPTIAEMVEGFPATGLRIMSRVGEFFQVARTEVLPVVPSVEQQATPPRSAMHARAGPLPLGDGSVGSQTGSPPQVVGSRSTPTSFAPGPGRETPLLNAEMLQRMQALEHRAPLFYPSQPVVSDRPQSGTDATSIPQEVIQAEVARQLAVLDQRATARELEIAAQELEIQRLRQQIAEANAHREQALRAAALSSAQSTAHVPVQPPQVAMQSQLSQASVPNMSQVQGVASQAVDASRSVAPAIQATSFPGLLSSLWSGLGGSRRSDRDASSPPPGRAGTMQADLPAQVPQVQGTQVPASPPGRVGAYSQVPHAQASGTQVPPAAAPGGAADSAMHGLPQVPPPPGLQGGSVPGGAVPALPGGTHGLASGSPALDALFLGMQQLQSVQLQQLRNQDSDAPEVVKPGTADLPKLAAPDPSTGSLDFQDWLQLVGGLMGDLSDTSGSWWAAVLQVSRDAYERWVVSSPIERLRIQPDDRPELVEGKWSRVNARACVMLLGALHETVKSDLIARKTTQVASHILFRLHTQYLPGGTAERTLVLSNLQHPTDVEDAASGGFEGLGSVVSALRRLRYELA